MKRLAIALVVTAAALAASSAHADTRVSIHIGAPAYRPAPPAVVYSPAPAVTYIPAPTVVVAPAHGYWKEIRVKTWVPERWVVRHNRWGRAERYCEPGYYTYRTDRVWVEDRHHDRHHRHDRYDRHDRRHGWN